jgi:uncharacterized protein involved in type VI secretion and phage assembly
MSLVDTLRSADKEKDKRFFGVVIGIVTDIEDPEDMGRVKVKFPWLASDQESHWARMSNLLAGPSYGSWFRPALDTEVLVAFEHGDIDHPYVLGMLWNGEDKPPQAKSEDSEDRDKVIKTAEKNYLIFGESEDNSNKYIQIRVGKADNNCVIQLHANGEVLIEADRIFLDAGEKISIKAPTVEIDAGTLKCSGSTSAEIKGATVDVKADGVLTLKGATVNIN